MVANGLGPACTLAQFHGRTYGLESEFCTEFFVLLVASVISFRHSVMLSLFPLLSVKRAHMFWILAIGLRLCLEPITTRSCNSPDVICISLGISEQWFLHQEWSIDLILK